MGISAYLRKPLFIIAIVSVKCDLLTIETETNYN